MNKINNQKIEKNKINRPWIITLFCILGALWLAIIFIGIIGILKFDISNNFKIIWLIIEGLVLILGIIALKYFWLMRKRGIYLLITISGIEIIWSLWNGLWPLSLSCGCEFPIILTILGLIYFKEMS